MDLEFLEGSSRAKSKNHPYPYGLLLLGGWIALGFLGLSWISWKTPETLREEVKLYLFHWFWFFPGGILLLYVPYFLALITLERSHSSLRTILFISILCRIAAIPGRPILETDIYRYLYDGFIVGMGQNPYRFSPREVQIGLREEGHATDSNLREIVDRLREDPLLIEILYGINNENIPTIYSPTAQAAFFAGTGLIRLIRSWGPGAREDDWSRPAEKAIVVWKGFILVFECGVLWLLTSLLSRLCFDPRWVIVYGWSPLVLKEYSNTGHFDPIVLFFLLAALRVLIDVPNVAAGSRLQRVFAGVLLALSIGVKIFPALLLPFLGKRLRLGGLLAVGLTMIAIHLPFIEVGSRMLTGLATYSDRWENNSGLVSFLEWGLAEIWDDYGRRGATESPLGEEVQHVPLFEIAGVSFDLDPFFLAKVVSGCVLLSGTAWILYRSFRNSRVGLDADRRTVQEVYWIVGLLLVVSPAVFPWYVGWIVPFLCFFRSYAWLYLTFATQAYYLRFWPQPVDYLRLEDLPLLGLNSTWEIIRPLEYIPFFLLLLFRPRHTPSLERKNF